MQGLPISWDPVVATASANHLCGMFVWSPCSRFIAAPKDRGIQIFDAVTLEQVNTLNCPDSSGGGWLSFSPNGHFLTQFNGEKVISWDLQTGALVCTILSELQSFPTKVLSSTYSLDGKMFAILYQSECQSIITTYDLFSGIYMNSYCVSDGHIIAPVWTHDAYIQFTVVESGSVTIWEAGFTLIDKPTEVETLSVPNEISGAKTYLFLPALSRLAFTFRDTIVIWDAKTSKVLLNFKPFPHHSHFNESHHFYEAVFSSDGHFFTYLTSDCKVYLWKESPKGYLLHQNLTISGNKVYPKPYISPDGGSCIVVIDSMIHLWYTEDQILFCNHIQNKFPFTLGISPQNKWAAFTQNRTKAVTILHLQSGDSQWVIYTDMEVKHLGLTERTIVIAGDNKAATYNLPARNPAYNTRVAISGGVHVINLENVNRLLSISPNLNYIACQAKGSNSCMLEIYELSTGRHTANATLPAEIHKAWFTPDGHTLWVRHYDDRLSGRKIILASESGVTKLEPLESHVCPPRGPSWELSTCGYQIVDDAWVLGPNDKRLLWLPPHWRTDEECRIWNGNFLGLRHEKLQVPIIVEFFE